jgi:hypothetical protein
VSALIQTSILIAIFQLTYSPAALAGERTQIAVEESSIAALEALGAYAFRYLPTSGGNLIGYGVGPWALEYQHLLDSTTTKKAQLAKNLKELGNWEQLRESMETNLVPMRGEKRRFYRNALLIGEEKTKHLKPAAARNLLELRDLARGKGYSLKTRFFGKALLPAATAYLAFSAAIRMKKAFIDHEHSGRFSAVYEGGKMLSGAVDSFSTAISRASTPLGTPKQERMAEERFRDSKASN